jgi:hypothetical protein
MQFFWHCSSWGQTLPQMAGKLFFSLIFSIASLYFLFFNAFMKEGMSTPTGQPKTHWGVEQVRHLEASAKACPSV